MRSRAGSASAAKPRASYGGVGFAQRCFTDRRAALVGFEHGDRLLSGHDHPIH